MVFGWGKKKTEETKTESKGSLRDISLGEVKNIVKEIRESRIKILIKEASSCREKINPQIDQIQKLTHSLEKDDLKIDDIDRHLKILVLRGKEQVISVIKKESSLKLPKVKSIDDAITIEKEISQFLKKVGDVLGRQSRVIHIFAKKYAAKLKVILSGLNSDKEQIHTLLQNHEKFDSQTSEILAEISAIDDLKKQSSDSQKRIETLSNNAKKNQLVIENTKKEILNLKSSDEYVKYLELKNKISKISEDQQVIEKEIDLDFTKISRPLTKYQYVSSLDKQQKVLLEKLNQNPFQVLSRENKGDIITILQSVRKGVVSGSVSVKDQTKSLEQIDEVTSSIDSFIKKITESNSKKTLMQKELKIFNIEKLKQKESDLVKYSKNKEDFELKIQNLRKEIDDSNNQIQKSIKKIESGLQSASSIKYTIVNGY